MGLGAVVHTLNPRLATLLQPLRKPHATTIKLNKHSGHYRLFERELDYIVNHAKDEYIMLDLTFVDLMLKLQHKLPSVKGFIIMTDHQHMPQDCKLHNVLCYEDLLKVGHSMPCAGASANGMHVADV